MLLDPKTDALHQWLDALVKGADIIEAKTTAACCHVQAARLLLEDEHATTINLERKAATAKGLLPSSSSSSTTSDMFNGAAYNSTLITNLRVQAMTVQNVLQLVNIVLDTMSSNYAIWHDLMLMALPRYSIASHVLSNKAFTDYPTWIRMDDVVLCWLTNTITINL
jgi:hypothetical protein